MNLCDCLFVLFSLRSASFIAVVVCQDQDQESTTTVVPLPLVADDVICTTCMCTDGAVDCAGRHIETPYSCEDWSNLLPQGTFVSLDLSHNPLTSLTSFPKLPIQTLNASNCQLESLEDGCFSNLTELVTVDLSFNKLSTFVFTRLTFLGPLIPGRPPEQFRLIRNLSLAHNDLHALPLDLFSFMKSLSTLDLSGNPLAVIDQVTMGAISELTDLMDLRLSGCELDELPAGILRRHPRLCSLDLSDNRLGTVPAALADSGALQHLSLDKNPLHSLEANTALSNLTKLRSLHLSRLSRLQSISAFALGGMGALKILHLCHNPRLTTVDPLFLARVDEHDTKHWPDIEELYLNNNNLSSIDASYLDRWELLRVLDYSNNPLLCDCNMQWASLTLPALLAQADTEFTPAICKLPPEMRGVSLQYLYETQKTLECAEAKNVVTAAEAEGIIFLGVLIGIFTAFPLVLVIVLVWKKGYFARCRRPGSMPEHYASEEELSNLKYR